MLSARQSVTKYESEFAQIGDLHWLVELPPAAREKLVEKSAMDAEHYCRRTHHRTRASSKCLSGGCVMAFGSSREFATHIGKRRLRQHPTRHRCEYPVRVQQLSRQEQPLSLRIPGKVAKYVGELQRAAQFRRNTLARGRFIAEYAQQ